SPHKAIKLLLRHLDNTSRVYSLCGNLPCGSCGMLTGGITENSRFMMGLPYPNPTTHLITIPYTLPANENSGTLRIYDMSGKEIRSYIVDRSFNSITLSTSDLSSGTYYYQLHTSGGYTDTKKVIKVE
ncbi:MAG: T9SS type A sorting domain-containing protein, partial [Flavobacteriales bacterium]